MELQFDSDSDSERDNILNNAKSAEIQMLPEKSQKKYAKVYDSFSKWMAEKKIKNICETGVLAYFYELSLKLKPSTLWSYHSMIKASCKVKDNVNIGVYNKLNAFLKKKMAGHKPVKASVFTTAAINNFITNAPDSTWLDVKVVCIFAVCGALRTDELTRIKCEDVERHGELLLVNILESKTNVAKSFTIVRPFYDVVERYSQLRPAHATEDRFFLNYRAGKCTNQAIGKNKFSKMTVRIATYLQLPRPETYTGHSFRRSSATILANSGATVERLMRHGAWKSPAIAEGYVETSVPYKQATGEMINSSINPGFVGVSASAVIASSSSNIAASASANIVEYSSESMAPSTSKGIAMSSSNIRASSSANVASSSKSIVTSSSNGVAFQSTSAGVMASQGYIDNIGEKFIYDDDADFMLDDEDFVYDDDDDEDDDDGDDLEDGDGDEDCFYVDEYSDQMGQQEAEEQLNNNKFNFVNCRVTFINK